MKPLFVVNPRSGGGATARTWSSIRSTIERSLGEIEVAMTERAGHGIELAREGAKAGHPLVVAVGGDGTLHEVVNGLMQAKTEARVGLIGQGTGGDFRKSLGIEHRLDRYIDALASGRERPIDIGRFEGGGKKEHYFVNILSAGMGGLLDQYVQHSSRALGGTVAYLGATLRSLVVAKPGNLRCTTTMDGKTEERNVRTLMMAFCNGQYFGAGMHIAPMAQIDDGAFDVIALGPTNKVAFVATQPSVYRAGHVGRYGTVHFRTQKITVDLTNEDARDVFLLDVDGEPMGGLPITVEVMPKALVLRG